MKISKLLRRKNCNKRRAFTLFEMLLVLFLIATALGTIAIQVPKAWKKETFEGGVSRVISKIELAQELMLNSHLDVVLILTLKGKGLDCEIRSQQPVSEAFLRKLNRYKTIEGITEIGFDHERANRIELHFENAIGATREGTLVLGAEGKEQKICLPGFPSRIVRGEYVKENIKKIIPTI